MNNEFVKKDGTFTAAGLAEYERILTELLDDGWFYDEAHEAALEEMGFLHKR